MADNKEYMMRQEEMGAIQISEDVVASIATSNALEIDGVSGLLNSNMSDFMGGKKMTSKGVRVETSGDSIAVNLFLTVRYGCAIGDIAAKVQQTVSSAVESMTGFQVSAVNVHVGGISFN